MKPHWMFLIAVLAACGSTTTGDSQGGENVEVAVVSVVPAEALRGGKLTLRVLGQGFDATSSVSFLLGGVPSDGIIVDSVQFVSVTELRVYVNIKPGAHLGRYGVRITTGRGTRGTGNEKFRTLIDMEVLNTGWAYAINNAGTLVGYMTPPGGNSARAFWRDAGGSAVALPGLSGLESLAYHITDNNLIVGVSGAILVFRSVPVRWRGDAARTQDELFPATSSQWTTIKGEAKRANNAGLIVGWVTLDETPGGAQRSFCWRDAGWTILAPKNANYISSGVLWDVNEPGDAVGRVVRLTGPTTGISEALVVHCHAATPTLTILQDPDQSGATAHAIADDGTVYGNIGGKAVRWRLTGADQWGSPELLPGVPFLPERVTAGGRLVGAVNGIAYLWDSTFGLIPLSADTDGAALAWSARDSGPGTPVDIVGTALGNDRVAHWRWVPPTP